MHRLHSLALIILVALFSFIACNPSTGGTGSGGAQCSGATSTTSSSSSGATGGAGGEYACAYDGGPDGATCTPDLPACPEGFFQGCPPDGNAVPSYCCGHCNDPTPCCSTPEGVLTNTCPGCPASSGPCAVAPNGAITCCVFGGCPHL